MSWQTPKTDWEIKPLVDGLYQGDWFNIADYNRIVENLRFLHVAGQNVYSVSFSIMSMIEALINAFPKAADLNVLEDNVYTLTQNLYSPPAYTGKKTWIGNGATPTVDDLNRLEQALADIYANLLTLATYGAFVPSDADAFVTSDGLTFRVFN